MTQLPFNLALPPRYGRSDFLVSTSNQAAMETLDRWPNWPDRVLLLVGPAGSGKTHLCHLWAERAGARFIAATDLAIDTPDLAAGQGAIDGADSGPFPEVAFFHLLNLVRQAGTSLLVTARRPPDQWGLRTPDLLSRLRLAPMVGIDPPDDALMRAVLVKLFDDRQIRVDGTLIDYLALRLDRSLDAAGHAVEVLDAAGLSRGRRITRAMASEVLQNLLLDGD